MVFIKITAHEINDALLEEIAAIDQDCIRGCIDNKVYLNPEKIIPSDQGLFLNVQNEHYLHLPMIYSDEYGCYITPMLSLRPSRDCPNCGQSYIGRCRNPDCPGNAKIKQAADDKKKKKEDYNKAKKKEKDDKKDKEDKKDKKDKDEKKDKKGKEDKKE